MMEKEDIIKDKSMDFAIRVVNLCKYLKVSSINSIYPLVSDSRTL